uniref:Uncharacterized protein n=1 Tax=Romanomermis culicivorax TaxID=13658 RepID=A0A915IL76_ROMCU
MHRRGLVTVGRFPQNYSYPLRPKIDFQAERFKLLTICSVPSKKATYLELQYKKLEKLLSTNVVPAT